MSNPIPSSLALSTVANGTLGDATPVQNNFAEIQNAVNAQSSALSGGTLGQVLQAVDGTDVQWTKPPGYEIGYDQIASLVNITGTTLGGATTIIAGSAHAFDGAPVIAEFYTNMVKTPSAAAGNAVVICLFEATTLIGTIAQVTTVTNASQIVPVLARYRFTPTATSHTYSILAFASNTTGTPQIDASGTNAPAYLRFTKV